MRLMLLASLGLAWLLIGSATAQDGARSEQAAPPAKTYTKPMQSVKIYVLVEVRGVYRHTQEGAYVEAEEEVHLWFRTAAPEVAKEQKRWQLDLTAIKLAPDELKQLDGKPVEISGKAELRWVLGDDGPHLGGPFPKVPAPTLELQRRIVVDAIKPVTQ